MNDEPETGRKGKDALDKIPPGMRQYQAIKEKYPDSILFFHIGDFYETFGADAELVSRELDIVLTSRSRGSDNRIPLAGVPYHASEGYIAKLVGRGYKVAVCDQLEDAKNAKGIVKRDVVRVITPGTVIDSSMLPSLDARYLMALCPAKNAGAWGLSFLDISTGEFFVTLISGGIERQEILSEIARYRPAECIVPSTVPDDIISAIRSQGVSTNPFRDDAFEPVQGNRILTDHFHVTSLSGFGCDIPPTGIGAAAAALIYAKETQNTALPHISRLSSRTAAQVMVLDAVTLRNLEVTEGIRDSSKSVTLLSCIDRTSTAMGGRLLRMRVIRPLLDIAEINNRLDAVEYFSTRTSDRIALRSLFTHIIDMERIAARTAYGNVNPRELRALAMSLDLIPQIKKYLTGHQTNQLPHDVREATAHLREMPEISARINKSIADDPPLSARNGGVIRPGYSAELDELTHVLSSGKDWIADLQQKERDRTGIRSLKIGYNRIFGYYIDVTRPNLHLVPGNYERKQTTANGERYSIPELREKEALITNADEHILSLERTLYDELVGSLRAEVPSFQAIAQGIAALDVSCALAEAARNHNYVRPVLEKSDRILIRDGRHPVVEHAAFGQYVPNDTDMSGSGTQIMIITGANMAGKSTYMRAVALICIMAQAGSFVPATHAAIGVIDRIFTRVGAFDDLARGQSTFMVEMLEVANILNNVTVNSLVILDEIGRGTSTVDGYAIAQAVLEELHTKSHAGPKTLFATHFHELVTMESVLKRVNNFHFAVKETKSDVIFLRKLIPGATDKSYGIHVARLAGIPKKVTERAEAVLSEKISGTTDPSRKVRRYTQLLIGDDAKHSAVLALQPVLEEIQKLDPDMMTPLQALQKLHELKKQLKDGGGT
jgi:DNA mismatch repair protein MutS